MSERWGVNCGIVLAVAVLVMTALFVVEGCQTQDSRDESSVDADKYRESGTPLAPITPKFPWKPLRDGGSDAKCVGDKCVIEADE